MENKAYFGSLTDRMKAFREEVLDEKPYIDAQRAVLATKSATCNGKSTHATKNFRKHEHLY